MTPSWDRITQSFSLFCDQPSFPTIRIPPALLSLSRREKLLSRGSSSSSSSSSIRVFHPRSRDDDESVFNVSDFHWCPKITALYVHRWTRAQTYKGVSAKRPRATVSSSRCVCFFLAPFSRDRTSIASSDRSLVPTVATHL